MGEEQIDAVLWLWAAWQGRLEAAGIGFGGRTTLGVLIRRAADNATDSTPMTADLDAIGQGIDSHIAALPDDLRMAVMLHYLLMADSPAWAKAHRAGCSDRTFRSRLGSARRILAVVIDRKGLTALPRIATL